MGITKLVDVVCPVRDYTDTEGGQLKLFFEESREDVLSSHGGLFAETNLGFRQ